MSGFRARVVRLGVAPRESNPDALSPGVSSPRSVRPSKSTRRLGWNGLFACWSASPLTAATRSSSSWTTAPNSIPRHCGSGRPCIVSIRTSSKKEGRSRMHTSRASTESSDSNVFRGNGFQISRKHAESSRSGEVDSSWHKKRGHVTDRRAYACDPRTLVLRGPPSRWDQSPHSTAPAAAGSSRRPQRAAGRNLLSPPCVRAARCDLRSTGAWTRAKRGDRS